MVHEDDKPTAGRRGADKRRLPRIKRGLKPATSAARFARPAAASTRARQPIVAPIDVEPIQIETHRAIVGSYPSIAARVNADPAFSVMLMINPVLALEAYGISLAPDIRRHVLHAIQHPVALRQRRDELEASLTEALGEEPRPEDDLWTAALLFERLKLKPLAVGDAEPVFRPALNAEMIRRLNAMRPKPTNRYPRRRRLGITSKVSVRPWREAVRRLDLDAPVPRLPETDRPPARVPFENLWFYKDMNPLIRDLVELGMIRRAGFPFHTPDGFRQIMDGQKTNAFRTWIRAVRFKERDE